MSSASRDEVRLESSGVERPPWFDAQISTRDFGVLRGLIEQRVGIRMPEVKRTMLEARLRPRLRALGLTRFSQYCELLLDPCRGPEEAVAFIDRVTTNKTDFFREPAHFDYLVHHAWPTLVREHGAGLERDLEVWCAACSSGEEAYTLAMVLNEAASVGPPRRFRILATDISTEVLSNAQRAIYTRDQIQPVPRGLRSRYFLQSKDPTTRLVRVAPTLRAAVTFRLQNLMDDDYGIRRPLDVIFCRNVFIYFERKTQERVLQQFCRLLVPGGYVFLGHSEVINGHDAPLQAVAPTTYRTIAERRSR